jgi:hypothetical protein
MAERIDALKGRPVGRSAAIAQEKVASTIPVPPPNLQILFIARPITQADQTKVTFIPRHCDSFAIPRDDSYSSMGPTLQLAAETVASRLRRPITCSRIVSLFD